LYTQSQQFKPNSTYLGHLIEKMETTKKILFSAWARQAKKRKEDDF
jgi:hypothetical protein